MILKSTKVKNFIFRVFFVNAWLTSKAHKFTETSSLPTSYTGNTGSFTNIYSTVLKKIIFKSLMVLTLLLITSNSFAGYIWNGNLTIADNKATGSAGSVGITFEDLTDSQIENVISMVGPGSGYPSVSWFPAIYNIPSSPKVTTLQELEGHQYKITFSQPVDNPLVAIGSLGSGSTTNRFTFNTFKQDGGSAVSGTVDILWQNNWTNAYTTSGGTSNSTDNSHLTGVTFFQSFEGNFIAQINQTNVVEIVFTLLNAENYMTVMAGYNNAADPTTSTVTASPATNVYANGSASSLITVQVKDEFGSSFGAGGETVSIATDIGTISSTTDNNNGTYTATLTSTTVGTATLTATLNGTVVTDTATVAFVDAPPILSSSSPSDNAPGVSTTANIVLTFSEAVDVESGNITIKKTSGDSDVEIIDVTDVTKVSGSGTTTITINPATTLAVSTEYYVLIDATAFDDTAGESYAGISSTTALSFTTGADSTPPTMTITAAEGVDGFESDDATLSLTFTSNEATSNFAEADITVSNATLSNFTAVSATVYTATLTPTAAGAVTIDVAAGTFTDANANNNLAATQFNWTYGSDPTKKADVMGTIQATSNAAIGFTSTSIKSVRNRLDWLRRNKDKEKTSHQGIKIAFSNPILNYVVNNNSLDFTTLTHQAVAHTNTSAQMNNPAIQTALSQMNKSASEMMKQVEDKYQVVSLNPNQSAGPLFNDWSIWTEGKIMAGSLDGNNGSANQESDTLNVAIGIDRPTANAGLVGVALNLGTDDVEVGSAGSGIESKNISLSLYNIIKTKNLLDVETQFGLGRMSIDTVRKDGSQTLNGDRDVMMPFASVAIRNKPFQYQAASLTPYGRAEWAYIELDSYTENGGNLALQYDKQKINRYMLFVGSDVNYETSFASGRLKPFAAFEYGLDLTSNSDVSMNYAGVNTKYQTQLEKVATSNVMLRLGLDYKREDETNFSISYERQEAIGAGNSDSIQFKFSKVLGKVN